jgi:Fe-S-cluster containining protein
METEIQEKPRQVCQRCGQCCIKGGPALHVPDLEWIERGEIPLTALFTIRPGERAYDNVSGGLFQVTADIVKIRSAEGSRSCLFYDEAEKACRIYGGRPLECRLQACWDSTAMEQAYADLRISRFEILQNRPRLMEMIEAHEEHCHFAAIHHLTELREAGDTEAAYRLSEIINYDHHFREIAVNRANIPADLLDFLIGRPLSRILKDQFGVKIVRSPGGSGQDKQG